MKTILTIAMLSVVALTMAGCKNDDSSSDSSAPSAFTRDFHAAPNSEPASVNPNDAGPILPNAEPENI